MVTNKYLVVNLPRDLNIYPVKGGEDQDRRGDPKSRKATHPADFYVLSRWGLVGGHVYMYFWIYIFFAGVFSFAKRRSV